MTTEKLLIKTNINASLGVITLDRADAGNALNLPFLKQLSAAVLKMQQADDVRVILLISSAKAFSIGGDMHAFAHQTPQEISAYATELVGELNHLMLLMMRCPKPIVVGCEGIVTGGSMGLLLAADMVFVAPAAKVRPWYAAVGFTPDGGWSVLLPRLIGKIRAADILMFDRVLDAAALVDLGIATSVVAADPFSEEVEDLARILASKPVAMLRATKSALNADVDAIEAGLQRELENFVAQISSPDGLAGIQRFLEERTDYPKAAS